jgi:hypothetical protein
MSIEALFKILKIWKQQKSPSIGKWINYSTPDNEVSFSAKKEMSSQAMKRHGGTVNACY